MELYTVFIFYFFDNVLHLGIAWPNLVQLYKNVLRCFEVLYILQTWNVVLKSSLSLHTIHFLWNF